MPVPVGFVREVLVEIAAQCNTTLDGIVGSMTWSDLEASDGTLRRLADDLESVVREWGTVAPPAIVQADDLKKAKTVQGTVVSLVKKGFSETLSASDADGLISSAKTTPRGAQALAAIASSIHGASNSRELAAIVRGSRKGRK